MRWLKQSGGWLARTLGFIWIVLLACPVRTYPIYAGLDQSWAWAMNAFHRDGVIFGRDVVFTYGPLAYLALSMKVGSNLTLGIAYQVALLATFAAAMGWLVFVRRMPLAGLALLLVMWTAGRGAFTQFGYVGVDHFQIVLALLLAGCSLVAPRPWWFLGAAIGLAGILPLIKLSAGVVAAASLAGLAAGLVMTRRTQSVPMLAAAVGGPPVVCCAAYLLYNPSIADLARYLRGSFEISSGYSVAMSLGSDGRQLAVAGAVVLAFVGLTAAFWISRTPAFPLSLAALAAVVVTFKHGFVRQQTHAMIFFTMAAVIWGIVVLFAPLERAQWKTAAAVAALTLVPLYGARSLRFSILWEAAGSPFDEQALWKIQLTRLDHGFGAREDRLPPALIARIGDRPIAIFPWELAYAAANPSLRHRPFPVPLAINASTPMLDGWNAAFLTGSNAPEFVLAEWKAIDGRHPLLEVPATSLEMFRWFDIDETLAGGVLLRRRATPRFEDPRPISGETLTIGRALDLPSSREPLLIRAPLRLTPAGRILRLAYRVPEVTLAAVTEGGRFHVWRVTPELLAGGVPSFLPADLDAMRDLWQHGIVHDPIRKLLVSGPGAAYYEVATPAEILRFPSLKLTAAPQPAAPESSGVIGSWEIESMNGVDVARKPEVIAIPAPHGYVRVTGWALDSLRNECAGGVFIELDGRPFPATYGAPRPDIHALFRQTGCATAGFEWGMLIADLTPGPHTLAIRILNAQRTAAYGGGRVVRFQVE